MPKMMTREGMEKKVRKMVRDMLRRYHIETMEVTYVRANENVNPGRPVIAATLTLQFGFKDD